MECKLDEVFCLCCDAWLVRTLGASEQTVSKQSFRTVANYARFKRQGVSMQESLMLAVGEYARCAY